VGYGTVKQLNIKIRNNQGVDVAFKVKETTRFGKQYYCRLRKEGCRVKSGGNKAFVRWTAY
jgi:hypothetical protein